MVKGTQFHSRLQISYLCWSCLALKENRPMKSIVVSSVWGSWKQKTPPRSGA